MRRPSVARNAVIWAAAALVTAGVSTAPDRGSAGAATTKGTITGEGGDAVGPIIVKLLDDDTAGLAPDLATYTNVDLDQGIADFVGSAPGTFGTDFAVSERPLTSAEAATATTNGRSFAYVPFVATPVALMTLVPNSTFNSTTIDPAQFCQHIPLTLSQLDGIYGAVSPPYNNWGDSRLTCTSTATTPPQALDFQLWANLDPTMENEALMSLLDSTTASEADFQAGLTGAERGVTTTSNSAASEHWPYSGTALTGGDQATVGHLIGLNPETNAPSTTASALTLGAIMPVASDWTGDPLGVTWNLPTAAVQNGGGAFVAPSAAAAEAAEGHATLAATTDPTTNNLVTFDLSSTDASAYNAYLMMESYLVVPTNGLSADKALALAQFIRFVVGGTGQADITALGAAPATPAMVTADLAVAQQLDTEAASTPNATTSTTTTTSGTSTSGTSTSTTVAATAGTGNSGTGSSSPSTDGSSSGGLAVTGSNPLPLLVLGFVFLVCGEAARQFLRRRRART